MIVLGIDPGFAALGAAVVEFLPASTRVRLAETVRTSTKLEPDERLDHFIERICDLIEAWKPAAIGYENQAGVAAGIAARARREDEDPGGMNAAARRVLEVTGAVRACARFYALPCYCLAPSTIKVALLGKGGGHAPKQRMKDAVERIFSVRGSEHAADAVAIAIAAHRRHRIEVVSKQRAASLMR